METWWLLQRTTVGSLSKHWKRDLTNVGLCWQHERSGIPKHCKSRLSGGTRKKCRNQGPLRTSRKCHTFWDYCSGLCLSRYHENSSAFPGSVARLTSGLCGPLHSFVCCSGTFTSLLRLVFALCVLYPVYYLRKWQCFVFSPRGHVGRLNYIPSCCRTFTSGSFIIVVFFPWLLSNIFLHLSYIILC